MPEGAAMVVNFRLNDLRIMALNGGPLFTFNESISIVVNCETQAEIDHYWNSLTEGGQESQCGWLKDKYGVSWQIVPAALGKLLSDPSKAGRVTRAFLQMKKFDIEKLLNA
jgi:predicted 3-demethylubiquinone-9 3-methyltransferase (glyoxalase superfamily)